MMDRSVKENVIERELIARVQAAGGVCIKVQSVARRGFFDRLVVLPGGRIIFVECKRPRGGRLAIHQRWYAETFRALGARVEIVANYADIDRLFIDNI
jgi:Holliday junction resolvase